MSITKEEFENRYIEESEISQEFYNDEFITLPCTCDGEDCEGWAAISNNPLSLKGHNYLYNHEHETFRGRSK